MINKIVADPLSDLMLSESDIDGTLSVKMDRNTKAFSSNFIKGGAAENINLSNNFSKLTVNN
jgi:hypothetical protein